MHGSLRRLLLASLTVALGTSAVAQTTGTGVPPCESAPYYGDPVSANPIRHGVYGSPTAGTVIGFATEGGPASGTMFWMLSLAPLEIPFPSGTFLLVDPDLGFTIPFATDPSGKASIPVNVPYDPVFDGLHIYSQVFAGGPPVVGSNGVELHFCYVPGSELHLNELYVSHAGTDDQEYVELVGSPLQSLDGVMVLVVEGDFGAHGTLDRAYDLSGLTMPADGFFVLGDTAVVNLDLDVGATNTLENGTETFYLVRTDDVSAVTALVGLDLDPEDDGTTVIPSVATIIDSVGMTDDANVNQPGFDAVYDGAQVIGPDGTFFPAGIYRGDDWPNGWCTEAFLDFDDDVNLTQPRTPGEPNVSCPVDVFLNELYVSHAGTDDQEYVELIGTPNGNLDGYAVLVVEGDFGAHGTLDRVYDLAGLTIPADGYFVLGDTAVANLDLDVGTTNTLENGTETFYLVKSDDVSALTALLGTDLDPEDDGTTVIPDLATIVDMIGLTDDPMVNQPGFDAVYDGAAVVGPDGTFLPAGIYRGDDFPNDWCTTSFLDFDDDVNLLQPRTPGALNSPCL